MVRVCALWVSATLIFAAPSALLADETQDFLNSFVGFSCLRPGQTVNPELLIIAERGRNLELVYPRIDTPVDIRSTGTGYMIDVEQGSTAVLRQTEDGWKMRIARSDSADERDCKTLGDLPRALATALWPALQDNVSPSEKRERSEGLGDLEARLLAERAVAEALRERLAQADAELTALSLAVEEGRLRAEETLTLLAASAAAEHDLRARLAEALAARVRAEALLATANAEIEGKHEASAQAKRELAVLNQQVAALREQLGMLQALLDDAQAREQEQQVSIAQLGSQLNRALAQAAMEQRARAQAEEQRRRELEDALAQAVGTATDPDDLPDDATPFERYNRQFLGRLGTDLYNLGGAHILGERLVLSMDTMFPAFRSTLLPEGKLQIDKFVTALPTATGAEPVNWIIRIDAFSRQHRSDGPADTRQISALNQERALAIVAYMRSAHGLLPEQLSADGFGETSALATTQTSENRRLYPRVELRLLEG